MKLDLTQVNSRRAVALVVTLLMLSVITFLAVAFLVMTRRDTSAKVAALDVSTAQSMSEAGLARAEAEIVARMMAQTDTMAFDYMASSNFSAPSVYFAGLNSNNYTNVNYFLSSPVNAPKVFSWAPNAKSAGEWAQNIANLWYDPRPPVFVYTNSDPSKPATDFRYYVDLNRNGMFEGGNARSVDYNDGVNAFPLQGNASGPGEPEWIGVLADPTRPHSPSNYFTGRFAFLVLPIGKTLDMNYTGNESQTNFNFTGNKGNDLYVRDQGVGPWEMNLAAYLRDLNTNVYDTTAYNPAIAGYTPTPALERYHYYLPSLAGTAFGDTGYAFSDALSIVSNRMRGAAPLNLDFRVNYTAFEKDGIDEYGSSPQTNELSLAGYNGPGRFQTAGSAPFEYDGGFDPDGNNVITRDPWPGGYFTNLIYDMQDVFDPRKAGNLGARLEAAGGTNGWPRTAFQNSVTYDRYTYERMLASIGTGSEPENGTYVYADGVTRTPGTPPTMLMAKMNLNYDNSIQLTNGPEGVYMPMPTNVVAWSNPLEFFTNAAERLLRTQEFMVLTNESGTNELVFTHFGLGSMASNYPIYSPPNLTNYNSTYRYSAQLHRMLQLAANLYDENHNNNAFISGTRGGSNIYSYYPSVFRPILHKNTATGCVFITGYQYVPPNAAAVNLALSQPWRNLSDLSFPDGANAYGVPWVIGAVKGLPNFNEMASASALSVTRKLNLTRPTPTSLPNQTNQIYEFALSNRFGIDAWNSYSNAFAPRSGVVICATNMMLLQLTNDNGNWSGPNQGGVTISNFMTTNMFVGVWPGWTGAVSDNSFLTPLEQDTFVFPSAFFSEGLARFSDFYPGFSPQARGFYPQGAPPGVPEYDTNTLAVHNWYVNVTNTMVYVLKDNFSGAILDFVNLGPQGNQFSMLQAISNYTSPNLVQTTGAVGHPSWYYVWSTNGGTDSQLSKLTPAGVLSQIQIGAGMVPNISDWQVPNPPPQPVTQFRDFLFGVKDSNTNLWVDDPLQPTVDLIFTNNWQANDPLVHYTADDLYGFNGNCDPGKYSPLTFLGSPSPTLPQPLTNVGLSQINWRYDPWPNGASSTYAHQNSGNAADTDVVLKDSGITSSDDWEFPTNRYPNVGWIGRVHRGTPWQTVFLKSDEIDPVKGETRVGTGGMLDQWGQTYGLYDAGSTLNQMLAYRPGLWFDPQVTTNALLGFRALAAYPTNDWRLLDLFTTAPNDNAMRGTLSVNQTNSAAWHALLDGVVVLTNNGSLGVIGTPIDPEQPVFVGNVVYPNAVSYMLNAVDGSGINAARTNQVWNGHSSQWFHHIGDVLQAAALTTRSPYLSWTNGTIPRDEVVERIPQQVGSLLRLGEPQFVIYAWGQSLRPREFFNPGVSLLSGSSLFKLCTNYSITGEFLTRTVCHLDLTQSDRFGQSPKLKIDSFNILPAAQ